MGPWRQAVCVTIFWWSRIHKSSAGLTVLDSWIARRNTAHRSTDGGIVFQIKAIPTLTPCTKLIELSSKLSAVWQSSLSRRIPWFVPWFVHSLQSRTRGIPSTVGFYTVMFSGQSFYVEDRASIASCPCCCRLIIRISDAATCHLKLPTAVLLVTSQCGHLPASGSPLSMRGRRLRRHHPMSSNFPRLAVGGPY